MAVTFLIIMTALSTLTWNISYNSREPFPVLGHRRPNCPKIIAPLNKKGVTMKKKALCPEIILIIERIMQKTLFYRPQAISINVLHPLTLKDYSLT